MFSRAFFKAAMERGIKSAAQAVVGVWLIGDGVFNAWTVQPVEIAGIAVGGFALSLLTSIGSAPLGGNAGPSVGGETPTG